jgi:hypothetical protein
MGLVKNADNSDNDQIDGTGGVLSGIRLFPNPCRDVFTISDVEKQVPVYMNNALGKTVLESTLQAGNNTIFIGNLPAGVYFVHVGDFPAKILVVQPE